jgi:DNA-nicking Smr family endonuclease
MLNVFSNHKHHLWFEIMPSNDDSKKSNASDSFASMVSSTKILKSDRVAPYRKKIEPIARQRIADDQRVMEELLSSDDEETSFHSGDELKYIRDGYPPRLLKRLRRGDYSIQDELDLHGLFANEAKEHVHGFINECARSNITAVRIIHGKGIHSRGKKPVLKNLIIGWLKKNQFIIAACSTPGNDGSTGAIYVLIDAK